MVKTAEIGNDTSLKSRFGCFAGRATCVDGRTCRLQIASSRPAAGWRVWPSRFALPIGTRITASGRQQGMCVVDVMLVEG